MKTKKMTQVDWVKETYVKPLPLSNAERQKLHRAKLKQAYQDNVEILACLEDLWRVLQQHGSVEAHKLATVALENLISKYDPDFDFIPF